MPFHFLFQFSIFRCSISTFHFSFPFSTFQVYVPWPWLSPRVHALYAWPLQCVRVRREPWNGAISTEISQRACANVESQDKGLISPAFYLFFFELIVYYSLCGLPHIQRLLHEVHDHCVKLASISVLRSLAEPRLQSTACILCAMHCYSSRIARPQCSAFR